jgi:hypothetical protein
MPVDGNRNPDFRNVGRLPRDKWLAARNSNLKLLAALAVARGDAGREVPACFSGLQLATAASAMLITGTSLTSNGDATHGSDRDGGCCGVPFDPAGEQLATARLPICDEPRLLDERITLLMA